MKKANEQLKMKKKNHSNWLTLGFILAVSLILVLSVMIVVLLEYFFIQTNLINSKQLEESGLMMILLFGFSSIIVGMGLSAIVGRILIKPVDTLIDGMQRLSDGDYATRINLGKFQVMKNMAKGFNALAGELQNTEILRSDFVNNFSHELKTPLVSVSGLVGLLKNEDLPPEKRLAYLEIIEEETTRLAEMTTNMLNLSKVEKQEILTDKFRHNVSEQIRTCVLLLEKKWTKKELDLSLDFEEVFACVNEDLLKQVWINLLDNAIKYAENGSMITVGVLEKQNQVVVSITNKGKIISETDLPKIFNKFYQADWSIREGNGIGLSIVKRIVDLHSGEIEVVSQDMQTTFTIKVPKY